MTFKEAHDCPSEISRLTTRVSELTMALRECRKRALFSIDVIAALHPEASVPMTAAYHAVDENTAWADEADPVAELQRLEKED